MKNSLTAKEVAAKLEISISSVHSLNERGTLKSFHWFEGKRIWKIADVEAYMADPSLQKRRRQGINKPAPETPASGPIPGHNRPPEGSAVTTIEVEAEAEIQIKTQGGKHIITSPSGALDAASPSSPPVVQEAPSDARFGMSIEEIRSRRLAQMEA